MKLKSRNLVLLFKVQPIRTHFCGSSKKGRLLGKSFVRPNEYVLASKLFTGIVSYLNIVIQQDFLTDFNIFLLPYTT